MTRRRSVPERKSITLEVGPMYSRGDLVKAPNASTSKASNCAFRRGVVEKRFGYKLDSGRNAGERLYQFSGTSANYLVASTRGSVGGPLDAYYSTGNGTWSTLTDVWADLGAVQYENTLYMLGSEGGAASKQSRIDSFDGTTITTQATTTHIGGTAVTAHIGRLIIGSPTFYHSNGGSYLFGFNTAGEWTVSGAWSQPTGTGVRTATIANATTDTIKSTAAVYTTGSTDEYVTIAFEVQAVSATTSTPIKVRIEDSAGTAVYGQAQYVISSATDDPEYRQYTVTAFVPTATAVYAALQIGNDSGGGTVGVQLRLADEANNHGFAVYRGRFIYPFGAQSAVTDTGGTAYANRVYFSEPLDFTDWRNENFAEVDELPGPVTAMGVVSNRLVVFKNRGMWIFSPTESALRPFVRELFLPTFGCVDSSALTVFDNVMYFIADNEVYAFDGGSLPKPLCAEAMRDEIYNTRIYTGVIAVDTDNRELWVRARSQKIYIYSIDIGQWVGYYEMPTLGDSLTAGDVLGMVFFTPFDDTSRREMWFTFSYQLVALPDVKLSYMLRLNRSTTLDFDTTDVVAEYVFHPLETPRWRKQMTVQRFGIDHKITGAQATAVTEYSVSLDGGSTWSKYNQVRVPVATGEAVDTDPIRVPLHQTAPRIVVKIKHTGPGGPTYFNMTGAEAEIIVRGTEIQSANPTAVGSSL